jgi:hypothetical protein
MIAHTLVLDPGLRIYKIYNGYWFFGRPTVVELRLDLRACCSAAVPIGISAAPSSGQPGRQATRRDSIRTAKPTRRSWPNKIDSTLGGL